MRDFATTHAKTTASASSEQFLFCSSLADDAYHASDEPTAYEWWYFDAVSDNGRDAIVIIFLDNFIFSPSYNLFCDRETRRRGDAERNPLLSKNVAASPRLPLPASQKFPAVAFCYYRDGKPIYRAINEFTPDQFSARTDFPACRIGESEFSFEAAPYGVRYIVNVNADLRGGKRLKASLEWLVVENDYSPLKCPISSEAHFWNLASPRSDVTGRVEVFDQTDRQQNLIQFRGTGYHDHNFDTRWLPATVAEWQWGRAHFSGATAVFYRYREIGASEPITKFFLIKGNKLSAHDATFAASRYRRNYFGVHYPQKLDFLTEKDALLTVKQTQIIDASFFYLRFLSEMTLDLGDGKRHETTGITEHLAPKSLRWRWLDWLTNMRIGRNGNGAFLP